MYKNRFMFPKFKIQFLDFHRLHLIMFKIALACTSCAFYKQIRMNLLDFRFYFERREAHWMLVGVLFDIFGISQRIRTFSRLKKNIVWHAQDFIYSFCLFLIFTIQITSTRMPTWNRIKSCIILQCRKVIPKKRISLLIHFSGSFQMGPFVPIQTQFFA